MTDHVKPSLALLPPIGGPILDRTATRDGVQLLTWNVQRASRTRTHQQLTWLCERAEADVVVLTEVAGQESGDLLARWLEESGYDVLLPAPGVGDRYRVLLACRGGSIEPVGPVVAAFGHRCVTAQLKLPQGQVGIAGLYVPSRGPRDRRNIAKRAFQDAVVKALPTFASEFSRTGPVLIMGDFNVVEPGHRPHYSVFGTWEYNFYRAFGEFGFTDAFRLIHPERADYSWFGRPTGEGQRNGYRIDHCFISAAHSELVRDCHYVHEARERNLSDHSAMRVRLTE